MKRFLAILVTIIMAGSLVACGEKTTGATNLSSTPSSVPSSTPPSSTPSSKADDSVEMTADEELFGAALGEFGSIFDIAIASVVEAMNGFDGTEEWYTGFSLMHSAFNSSVEELMTIKDQVPEVYAESYDNIVAAIKAYTNAIEAFGVGAAAYQDGETESGDAKMKEATDLATAADKMWADAFVEE